MRSSPPAADGDERIQQTQTRQSYPEDAVPQRTSPAAASARQVPGLGVGANSGAFLDGTETGAENRAFAAPPAAVPVRVPPAGLISVEDAPAPRAAAEQCSACDIQGASGGILCLL